MNKRHGCRFALVAGALLFLAGCLGSPKPEYITLSASEPAADPAALDGAPVSLGNVSLPASLDQPYLVRRNGPNALDISDTARWGAPLAELTHSTLARDLAARLAEASFVNQNTFGAGENVRVLAVTIDTFSANANNRVVLDARWQLVGGGKPQTSAARITRQAASNRADDIAGAMSNALEALATRMIAGLAAG